MRNKTPRLPFPALLLALGAALLLSACTAAHSVKLPDEKYRAAYEECVRFLEHESGWERAENIDLSKVTVETLPDAQKESVFIVADGCGNYFEDTDAVHWTFTIGETQGHDFAVLVCSSESGDVVGYIPIA